jgi:hypothetical protein
MGILGKLVKFNGMILLTGTGVTVYQYPELRKEPSQIFKATMRSLRCAKTGLMMANDYLNVSITLVI